MQETNEKDVEVMDEKLKKFVCNILDEFIQIAFQAAVRQDFKSCDAITNATLMVAKVFDIQERGGEWINCKTEKVIGESRLMEKSKLIGQARNQSAKDVELK